MKIIDCKSIRNEMLEEAKNELALLGGLPVLVVIQVGDDPASSVYIRNKIKTCEEVGITCEHVKMPSDVSFGELSAKISFYNDKATGIMLQLPLPDHLKPYQQVLLDMIHWTKDVDGLSSASMGRLWSDCRCIVPATAKGVMRLLPEDLSGKNVCILGRSNLVGKPLIKLLLDRNATPIVCHSKSEYYNLMWDSDIIISAIGKPLYITWDGNSRKRVIIDVGINRNKDGKLCGDVDIVTFEHTNCSVTPVPSGVGLLTTAQLVLNVIDAHRLQV